MEKYQYSFGVIFIRGTSLLLKPVWSLTSIKSKLLVGLLWFRDLFKTNGLEDWSFLHVCSFFQITIKKTIVFVEQFIFNFSKECLRRMQRKINLIFKTVRIWTNHMHSMYLNYSKNWVAICAYQRWNYIINKREQALGELCFGKVRDSMSLEEVAIKRSTSTAQWSRDLSFDLH